MKLAADKKVHEAYQEYLDSVMLRAKVDIDDCPEMTPIEQIVWLALKKEEKPEALQIQCQEQIGKYRVDFLIIDYVGKKIVIECDGHDFHEKTKEQAQRDKARDRELQAKGYFVYRFTGSEIWKTGGKCVLESLGIKG